MAIPIGIKPGVRQSRGIDERRANQGGMPSTDRQGNHSGSVGSQARWKGGVHHDDATGGNSLDRLGCGSDF